DHLDVVRLETDALPPTHDRLDQPATAAIDAELRMDAAGDDRVLCEHFATVVAAESRSAAVAAEQIARLEIADETRAERDRALQQDVVERPPRANQSRVGVTGKNELAITRRDQSQTSDRVSRRRHRLAGAECVPRIDAFGGGGAAAGLVPWKILPVHDDDPLDSELAEMYGRGEAGGTGTDDGDIGVDGRRPCTGKRHTIARGHVRCAVRAE